MKIANFTPHPIVVRTDKGDITLPPTGITVRIKVEETPAGELAGIPLVKSELRELAFIDKDKGECSIAEVKEFIEANGVEAIVVPLVVVNYLKGLKDFLGVKVLSPNTTKAYRDSQGRIEAVPNLIVHF